MKILTCNIRFHGAEDGENNWEHRKELCMVVIRSQTPDIICFQEMRAQQLTDVSLGLPEYRSYAMIDEPVGRHPQNGIFYREDV